MRGNPEGIVFVGAHGRAPLAETEQSRSRIFFRKHESTLVDTGLAMAHRHP
jgi:hypothetical protein